MAPINPLDVLKKPKAPQIIVQQTAAPTRNTADVQAAEAAEMERLKKQRGRAATILTSGYGVPGDDSFGKKATLGA